LIGLRGLGLGFLQVYFVEARDGVAVGEVDGRLDRILDDERVAVELDERGREHRAHELPQGGPEVVVATGERVAELVCHPLGSERLGAGDAGGVECEGGTQPGRELRDPAQRVGVGECAVELVGDDRVGVAGFVAAGVADGLLAFGVGPAGALGDQLPVVADEQPADDLPDGAKLGVGELVGHRRRAARRLTDATCDCCGLLRRAATPLELGDRAVQQRLPVIALWHDAPFGDRVPEDELEWNAPGWDVQRR
jgi:hypothetical protein